MSDDSAKHISALKALERVRNRPAISSGATDPRGLHHLLWEQVDVAVDEHLVSDARRVNERLRNAANVDV